MLGMALYVDHVERAGYDIPAIIDNWQADIKVVFTGSGETFDYLVPRLKNVWMVNIGMPIVRPHDIPIAFNACIDHMYEQYPIDALVWSHADVRLTKAGMDFVMDYYKRGENLNLCYMHVQLYVQMWHVCGALILSYKDNPLQYDLSGDGSMNNLKGWDHIDSDQNLVQDIGYLTVQHYFHKMNNHNQVWSPERYKTTILNLYRKDPMAALRFAYKNIRQSNGRVLEPVDRSTYMDLLNRYGVVGEFEACCNMMREVNG